MRKFKVDRIEPFFYPNDTRTHYRVFFPVPYFGEEDIEVTDGKRTLRGNVGYRVTGNPEGIEISLVPK